MVPSALRRRVLLSSTMLVAAVVGYGRRAYGACVFTGGSSYVCSGANVATQTITANNASVSTVAGFSVNTPAGNAITITGDGALSYTDVNASPLTAPATALYVRSNGDFGLTPGSVTIDTNGALSGGSGIYGRNLGTGVLTITANGNVTGTNVVGINAYNGGAASDLSVTTGVGTTVSGYVYGIAAGNRGTGALTIIANGNVTATGAGSTGIYARNSAASTGDLKVTTGPGSTVSGGSYGIRAQNFGTGALTIKAYGTVTGTAGTGIVAYNSATGTGLTITTGVGSKVSGADGISAYNYGGALTVTANGNVTATCACSSGIFAVNRGTNLNVTTGAGTTVSGVSYGIQARNYGTGALTITANGNVTGTGTGTGANGKGIYAFNSATSTGDLTVTTAAGTTVSGRSYGIKALNYGTGALTITANGNVTGTTNTSRGIYAYNSAAGTDLSVTTGAGTTVSGGYAISARNLGTGALTITANGNVTGTTGGIFVLNFSAGTDLSVTTGTGTTVSGATTGITARNFGTGALTITANGNVTGTFDYGIFAQNYNANSTNLSVTTAAGTTVSGRTDGIHVSNGGTGALSITANGNVTSANGVGIYALNSAASTGDLSVTTAAGTTVSGGTFGINARNSGTGALTVTANGNVTGTGNYGIFARNYAGTSLTVTTAAGTTVSGSTGIQAGNNGTGATTVKAYGNVSGTYNNGISVGATGGGDIAVTTGAGTTVSGRIGIVAQHYAGVGAVTITANGDVTGSSGPFSYGIFALATGGGDITVTTGAGTTVRGRTGITARNYAGTAAVTIIANGNVTGTGGDGIYARSTGGAIAITVAATGTVTSANAFAIDTVGGPATVTVAGTVAGSMQIGGAGSSLTFLTGAVYKVFVGSTASLANVNGTATLAGTVNASLQGGSSVNTPYTILTSTGGFGATRFAGVISSPNFATSLSYNLTDTDVFLTLNAATLGAGTPLSSGQQNVANAINSYFNNGGALPPGFATVFGLTGGALTNALSQLSGQPGATVAQSGFGAAGQFMTALFGTAFDGGGGFTPGGGATGYAAEPKLPREAAEAYAAVTPREAASIFDRRWNVWATGFGGSTTVDGNAAAGTNTTTSSVYGIMAGADYGLSPDTRLGFAIGGAGSSFNVANGFGGGKADIFNAAVYAKHIMGPAYLAGALAYGWQGTTTDRTVTIAGTDRLHASFNANAFTGRVESGWTFAMPVVSMTPYAALQSTAFIVPGYGETATSGSNQFALNYAAQTVVSTRSELGLHWDKTVAVTGGRFTWRATTAWAHNFNADNTATASATFQSLPGSPAFTTNGAAPASDLALVSAGAQMAWTNGWSLSGTFLSELASTSHSYGGKGTLSYAFN